MPPDSAITGLSGFEIVNCESAEKVCFWLRCIQKVFCIRCGCERLRKKAKFVRRVRHISFGERPSELLLEAYKYRCVRCGRYFNQRFPGIIPRKRSTEPFRREVFQKHQDGIAQTTLAKRLRMGSATVERWYQDMTIREVAKQSNAPCPRVMGIDEHFFSRKKGYATTFCDLGKRKVYDIALGRSEAALRSYLNQLAQRERVHVLVMDLSETYRSIGRRYFPNAKIVADRFHVIRLVNQQFLETWKQLDESGRHNRGLLSLMRRHRHKLKPEQQQRLQGYLQTIPGLAPVYDFKQNLCQLLLHRGYNQKDCFRLIPNFLRMIEQLKTCGFEPLKKLGYTLDLWKEEIARMWRFSKTNGITEGFHNKMEMIQRRAFGFKNFQNYRLRVKCLCG